MPAKPVNPRKPSTLPSPSIFEVLETFLFRQGMARLAEDPKTARMQMSAAFDALPETDPVKPLAWAGIVETYTLEWDDFRPLDKWISWLEIRVGKGLRFSDKEIEARVVTSMSKALMFRQPHHPDINFWIDSALTAAREFADINFRVQTYLFIAFFYFWRGDLVRFRAIQTEIESLAALPSASPLSRLALPCLAAFTNIWLEGAYESALTTIDRALEFAKENDILVWNHMLLSLRAYCRLARGQPGAAQESLTELAALLDGSRKHLYSQYYYLMAWSNHLAGQTEAARIQACTALEYAETTGYVFPQILCLNQSAWILDETGREETAWSLLERAKVLARDAKSRVMECAADLVQAGLLFRKGRVAQGYEALSVALDASRKNGYLMPPWWCDPPFMTDLCARALECDMETAHIETIICKRRLTAKDQHPGVFYKWPSPVKVFTLGRFELLRWGEPLRFSGKVQKKPLDMLKLLIAMEGENIRKERVMDSLWPDAEGDVAYKSFATTLYRLRQLLGEKMAIQLPEGYIRLDPRYCQVDSLCFLKWAEQWEEEQLADMDPASLQMADHIIAMYTGPFLADDAELSEVAGFREKLQRKCLHLLHSLGRHHEKRKKWEKALHYYEKGIEVDPLAEPVYRRLMVCYHQLGWSAETIRTYRRCKLALADTFGIAPSKPTQALLSRLFPERPDSLV